MLRGNGTFYLGFIELERATLRDLPLFICLSAVVLYILYCSMVALALALGQAWAKRRLDSAHGSSYLLLFPKL